MKKQQQQQQKKKGSMILSPVAERPLYYWGKWEKTSLCRLNEGALNCYWFAMSNWRIAFEIQSKKKTQFKIAFYRIVAPCKINILLNFRNYLYFFYKIKYFQHEIHLSNSFVQNKRHVLMCSNPPIQSFGTQGCCCLQMTLNN